MLLAVVALATQTVTLDADTRKAALVCAAAVVPAEPNVDPLRRSAHVSYYIMQAARADLKGQNFLDRVQGTMADAIAVPRVAPADAAKLMPECDKRFPLARATAPARLPTDPFTRDVTCFSALAILQGAAEQIKSDTGAEAPLLRVNAAYQSVLPRLGDATIKMHGISDDEGFKQLLAKQLEATLDLGNLEAVAVGCGMAA